MTSSAAAQDEGKRHRQGQQIRNWLVAPLRRAFGHNRVLDWYFAAYWGVRIPAYRLAHLGRPRARLRFGLISMWDRTQASLGEVTGPNKAAYCQRHGYDWCPQTSGFVTERPIAWSKIHFLRQLLPAYDWIMWSDADSLITNPAISLSALVDQPADLLITRDQNGVNSGSFLLRNCAWSRGFLDAIWNLPSQPRYTSAYELWSDHLWENRAFLLLLQHSENRRHCRYLPQRQLNSYYSEFSLAGPESIHQPGDFILHLPGIENQTRLKVLETYAQNLRTGTDPTP